MKHAVLALSLCLAFAAAAQETAPPPRVVALKAARLFDGKVAAHCHGDAAARVAIAAGVDSIEHGTFLQPDTLALMREKGTYLVPTLMAAESIKPRLDAFPESIANKARAAIASRDALFRNALKRA